MNIAEGFVYVTTSGELAVGCLQCNREITTYMVDHLVTDMNLTEVISLVDEHECKPVREFVTEDGVG